MICFIRWLRARRLRQRFWESLPWGKPSTAGDDFRERNDV